MSSISEDLLINIDPRHAEGQHYINIKYGYFILFLSGLHIIWSQSIKYIYLRKWSQSGSNINIWKKISSIPIWVTVIIWSLIYFILFPFHITEWSENYTTAIKRSGRIAYALIPLDIFLVLRPSNVIGFKIGYYLESLNLHKWISRLIVLAAVVHGCGFTYKWIIDGTILEKPFVILNFLGVVVFLFAVTLVIISIRPIRQRIYQVFYILHDFTAWIFVILIAFHARPGVLWIAVLNSLLFAVQIYQRFFRAHYVHNIQVLGKSHSLQIIRIERPPDFPSTFLPGSHIRLTYSNLNYKSWFLPTHPFTVVSNSDSNLIELIVSPTVNFQLNSSLIYSLTGPFPSLPKPFFETVQNLNIICGGSGISFGLPVFKYLANSPNIKSLNLIWCIRNKKDLQILENFFEHLPESLHIYITGDTGSKEETLFDEESEELLFGSNSHQEENIELDQLDKPTKEKTSNIHYNRPDFNEVFSSFHSTGDSDKQWLVACGPSDLVNDAHAWSRKNNVQFFSEVYEM
ncbi:ferric reductase [Scheffersomyces coipomensis]|uniref:ferric reductase n=1 Tax=Scheffersomyces coipomensis TaxID=1788519 RepID=UPI00315D2105